MRDRAVVFVTDDGYIAQSVLAARQLVRTGGAAIADVLIYTVDVDGRLIDSLRARIGSDVQFVPLESRAFVPASNRSFHRNHVPITSLARLVLEPELPRVYRHVTYLDGDIQVLNDISAMLSFDVPEGQLLAARGSSWLDPDGRYQLEPDGYLEALGGVPKDHYFNAGVLAFQRETWAAAGPQALRFFLENAKAAVRHDQSALNAVFKGNVLWLPPTYNFHHYYATARLRHSVRPRVMHFTGPAKPWISPGPWGRLAFQRYVDLLTEFPELRACFATGPPAVRNADKEPLRVAARARFRALKQLPGATRFALERRRLVSEYLRTGEFAIAPD